MVGHNTLIGFQVFDSLGPKYVLVALEREKEGDEDEKGEEYEEKDGGGGKPEGYSFPTSGQGSKEYSRVCRISWGFGLSAFNTRTGRKWPARPARRASATVAARGRLKATSLVEMIAYAAAIKRSSPKRGVVG